MDQIKKFLKKLNSKEREVLLLLMQKIQKHGLTIPGIKKLKGHETLYRVRMGRYRIIFRLKNKIIEITKITKRGNQTYKNLK